MPGVVTGPSNAQLDFFVILGAGVQPDGTPSGALRRRVEGALDLAEKTTAAAAFLVTGGAGRYGPPEGTVMKRMLQERGIREDRIVVDAESRDTLSSVK